MNLNEEKNRLKKLEKYEDEARREGYSLIAGVDEAGRGAWAGPVAAAAVVLPAGAFIEGLDDSKKLTPKERDVLYEEIKKTALYVSFAFSSPEVIDKKNILNATYIAMRKSIKGLENSPDFVLVDGRPAPSFGKFSQISIVKGDSKSISIAAASIIAKVTRDRKMKDYSKIYPEYGFERHKGYGTAFHKKALLAYGPCNIHRKSFRPVRELIFHKKDNLEGLWNKEDGFEQD